MAAPRKSAPRKAIPDNAPTPEDHKPNKSVQARKAAAGDGFATVECRGLELQIPMGDDVSLDLIEEVDAPWPEFPTEADERRRDIALTKALLGPEQWAAFKATRPTWRDYRELGTKINEIAGN
ncbi:MAG: adenylosuccinate synthase [Mycobacterium sp.]